MEGLAFVFIGAALFSHSWHVLGLYPDGRTMGTYVGALGLATLIALPLTPMLLVGGDPDAFPLAEVTVMKMLIILWAGYAVGVGAQGLWDFDERAIGFYSAIVTAGSAVAFFYFAGTLADAYGDDVAIGMSAVALVLSLVGGMVFFYLAVPFMVLRLVAGWFTLVGSIAVAGIGFAIMTRLIEIN